MAFINTLYNLWPNGDQKIRGLRDGIAASAPAVFKKYKIDTPLLVAHVMAQISHECGAGHDIVENLNYTAQRAHEVWPSRFPTMASAEPYAHNPRALANKVYNGTKPDGSDRMGNRPGTDDGWNFRGRGGSQTTGRDGYERVAKQTGLDVVNNPDILIDPKFFLECSVSDFINCGCLPYAKADDVVNVTKRLNGGTIGLDQRKEWLVRWKKALGEGPIDFTVPSEAQTTPTVPTAPTPSKPASTVPPPKPSAPSVTNPAPGSLGAFIASILAAIFKRN